MKSLVLRRIQCNVASQTPPRVIRCPQCGKRDRNGQQAAADAGFRDQLVPARWGIVAGDPRTVRTVRSRLLRRGGSDHVRRPAGAHTRATQPDAIGGPSSAVDGRLTSGVNSRACRRSPMTNSMSSIGRSRPAPHPTRVPRVLRPHPIRPWAVPRRPRMPIAVASTPRTPSPMHGPPDGRTHRCAPTGACAVAGTSPAARR